MNSLEVDFYLGAPPAVTLFPANSPDPALVVRVEPLPVGKVLGVGAGPKIFFPAIKRVVILVVHVHARWVAHDGTVKKIAPLSVAYSSRAHGIKAFV